MSYRGGMFSVLLGSAILFFKPTANNILNVIKLKSASSKFRNKTGMPTLTTFIHHSTGGPNHSSQARKREMNGLHIGKEEVKLIICR